MRHIWSLLCRGSSIDTESNLLSIFDCLEKIDLGIDFSKVIDTSNLVVPIDFQIINSWEVTDYDTDINLVVKFDLVDPNGKILRTVEKEFNVKKGFPSFRNRLKLQGLPVTVSGKYRFNIYKKNSLEKEYNKVASIPLIVQINKIA
jgi:hypothetical protein